MAFATVPQLFALSVTDSPQSGISNNTTIQALTPAQIRLWGSCLLLICGFLLISYFYVLFYMFRAKLWRQPFFFQLITLGCQELVLLTLYCFFLLTSIIIFPPKCEALRWAFAITAAVHAFVQSGCLWLYLVIAYTRALAVFCPVFSRHWFTTKRTLALVSTSWVYALFHFLLLPESWGVYRPDQLAMMPEKRVESLVFKNYGPNFGPSIALAIRAFPVLVSVILYGATIGRLCFLQKVRQKQRSASVTSALNMNVRISGNTPPINPTSSVENFGGRTYSRASTGSTRDAANTKAQWNMLRIAVTLMVLYIACDSLKPIVDITKRRNVAISGLYMLVEILMAGFNPYLYLFTCTEISNIVPMPKFCRNCVIKTDRPCRLPSAASQISNNNLRSSFRKSSSDSRSAEKSCLMKTLSDESDTSNFLAVPNYCKSSGKKGREKSTSSSETILTKLDESSEAEKIEQKSVNFILIDDD